MLTKEPPTGLVEIGTYLADQFQQVVKLPVDVADYVVRPLGQFDYVRLLDEDRDGRVAQRIELLQGEELASFEFLNVCLDCHFQIIIINNFFGSFFNFLVLLYKSINFNSTFWIY